MSEFSIHACGSMISLRESITQAYVGQSNWYTMSSKPPWKWYNENYGPSSLYHLWIIWFVIRKILTWLDTHIYIFNGCFLSCTLNDSPESDLLDRNSDTREFKIPQ